MRGARRHSLVEHALRRHWVLVLLVTVVVGVPLSLALNAMPSTSYRLTEGYIVAAEAEFDNAPVTANSDRAARDYASVLRSDDTVIGALASAAGERPGTVRDRLTVGYLPGTGTLFARYEADQRREVLDVIGALDELLVVNGVDSAGISPGQVRPLGLPAVEEIPNPLDPFPGAGVVAVLAAAVAGAVLLERLRSRVLDPAQLRELTDRAVIELDGDEAFDVLAFRTLVHSPAGVRVYAVPGEHAIDPGPFAARLGAAADALSAAGELPASAWGLPVLPADDLDEGSAGSVWVLLLELPTSLRPVLDALSALQGAPDVVLVVGTVDELSPILTSVPA
jgi:hypothetical protein